MTDMITPASLRAHADWFDTTFEPGSVEARSLRNCAARLEAESARDEYVETLAKVAWKARGIVTPWEKASGAYRDETLRSIRAVLDRLADDGRLLPEGEERTVYDETTLERVYQGLAAAGIDLQAVDVVNQIQNQGILFRQSPDDGCSASPAAPAPAVSYDEICKQEGPRGTWCTKPANHSGCHVSTYYNDEEVEQVAEEWPVPDDAPDGTPEKPWPTAADVPDDARFTPWSTLLRHSIFKRQHRDNYAALNDLTATGYRVWVEAAVNELAPFVRVDGDKA